MNKFCRAYGQENLPDLTVFLKLIAEENRLKIICFLGNHGEKCVCEIYEFLSLPQNLVSHHLKTLKSSNLIFSRKESQKVYYKLNYAELRKYKEFLNHILNEGEK